MNAMQEITIWHRKFLSKLGIILLLFVLSRRRNFAKQSAAVAAGIAERTQVDTNTQSTPCLCEVLSVKTDTSTKMRISGICRTSCTVAEVLASLGKRNEISQFR